jgi:hypothetical protein
MTTIATAPGLPAQGRGHRTLIDRRHPHAAAPGRQAPLARGGGQQRAGADALPALRVRPGRGAQELLPGHREDASSCGSTTSTRPSTPSGSRSWMEAAPFLTFGRTVPTDRVPRGYTTRGATRCHGNHLAREPGAHGLPPGPRLHGHVRVLRGRRRRRVDRHHPPRARSRADLLRHRRHVRAPYQRGPRGPGAGRRAATRRSSPPSSASCATPTIRPSAASTGGPSTCARPATPRCPARDRPHRSLLPAPGRSRHADRGDGRGHGRAGAGGQGALSRPVRGGAGHHPPGPRRAPDLGAADRVLGLVA